MVPRRHIPRGCRSNYIPGITEESKIRYEAYKKQFSSKPFGEGTLGMGTKLLDTMKEKKVINGRRSSRRLIWLKTVARHGRLSGSYITTQPLQTFRVWSRQPSGTSVARQWLRNNANKREARCIVVVFPFQPSSSLIQILRV